MAYRDAGADTSIGLSPPIVAQTPASYIEPTPQPVSFIEKLQSYGQKQEYKQLQEGKGKGFSATAFGAGAVVGFTEPIRHPIKYAKGVFALGKSFIKDPFGTGAAIKEEFRVSPSYSAGYMAGQFGLFRKLGKGKEKIQEIKTTRIPAHIKETGKIIAKRETRPTFIGDITKTYTGTPTTLKVGKKIIKVKALEKSYSIQPKKLMVTFGKTKYEVGGKPIKAASKSITLSTKPPEGYIGAGFSTGKGLPSIVAYRGKKISKFYLHRKAMEDYFGVTGYEAVAIPKETIATTFGYKKFMPKKKRPTKMGLHIGLQQMTQVKEIGGQRWYAGMFETVSAGKVEKVMGKPIKVQKGVSLLRAKKAQLYISPEKPKVTPSEVTQFKPIDVKNILKVGARSTVKTKRYQTKITSIKSLRATSNIQSQKLIPLSESIMDTVTKQRQGQESMLAVKQAQITLQQQKKKTTPQLKFIYDMGLVQKERGIFIPPIIERPTTTKTPPPTTDPFKLMGKPKKKSKKLKTIEKGFYQPSLLGREQFRIKGLTIPKAPKLTTGIGIRPVVAGTFNGLKL
jgi:hypothetical protein